MRITTSDNYYCNNDCVMGELCEGFYCNVHRHLYRSCDGAQKGSMGDGDVVNGIYTFWNSENDCPKCERVSRAKEAEWEARQKQEVVQWTPNSNAKWTVS